MDRTGWPVVDMLHGLVFVTKYRRDVRSEPAIRDLRRIFAKLCRDFEAELIECDGEDDQVPLLVHYPPKIALSKLVNSATAYPADVCARAARKSPGATTTAFCGRRPPLRQAPLSVIAEYVKSQREAAKAALAFPRPERRGIPRGSR
nr:transposase [Rhizobium gallicum]